VCSYARFGTGTSDRPATTQTFATQVADLQALLDEAGEPGPYVVLGHSFGGTEAVAFASQHPEDVVGLMLVDATPPAWPTAICAVPDDGTNDARALAALCASYDPTQNPERLDVFNAFDDIATIRSLDDLPMIVMSAPQRSLEDLGAAEVSRLNAVWEDGLDHWAALSTSSTTMVVEDTGHYIQVDQPDLVIEQLLSLLPPKSS
jgi:pimeloyl-ACP methyl ester carboxylesterase